MESLYSQYQNSKLWNVIEEAINELQKNNDLVITSAQDYVIGYLVKQIEDKKDKKK